MCLAVCLVYQEPLSLVEFCVLLNQCCVYNVSVCPDFNVSKFIASFLSYVSMDEADFCYQNYIMDILNGTIGWMLCMSLSLPKLVLSAVLDKWPSRFVLGLRLLI